MFKILSNDKLIPEAWKREDGSLFYVFNPALCRLTDRYAMCYRVINNGDGVRRLATCHLNLDFEPISNTITPLSDLIAQENADSDTMQNSAWLADARYFFLNGNWYISFNNGMVTKPNHQWLMKMDNSCLRPAEKAKEIILSGKRRSTEKNWMFFEFENEVYCTYSITPHRILKVDLSHPDQVICEDAYTSTWRESYSLIYNELRCSTPPIQLKGSYLSITHSRYSANGGLNSVCGFYEFADKPPFHVLRYSPTPFPFPGQDYSYTMEPLHKAVIQGIYTCGLIKEVDDIIVSYGLLNEKIAIAKLSFAEIRESLVSAKPIDLIDDEKPKAIRNAAQAPEVTIPLFWWDAKEWAKDRTDKSKKFVVGNFGDTASPAIVEALAGMPTRQAKNGEVKLISIGSVIHKASNFDIIWGTGVKGNAMQLDSTVKELTVAAVRGPLTLDFLKKKGIKTSGVVQLFDPGCLISVLYKSFIASVNPQDNITLGPCRIIPHFRDDALLRKSDAKFISNFIEADRPYTDMISKLLGAELVISSSLHGIIFAESLGIPACWLKSPSGEDELKFHDYYYGTDRFEIKRFDTIEEALKGRAMPLPKFNHDQYIASFPHVEIKNLVNNTESFTSQVNTILPKPPSASLITRFRSWINW